MKACELELSVLLSFGLISLVINTEFKLGMLSPFRHPRLGWENNAAAATIAVDKAQKEGLLVGHNIRSVYSSLIILSTRVILILYDARVSNYFPTCRKVVIFI